MCVVALASLPFSVVHADSDQTNLVQQILKVVKDIETKLTSLIGTTDALSTLQTDVSAIKAKTGNLPIDPASETTVMTRATQASVDAVQQAVGNLQTGGMTQVRSYILSGYVQCGASQDYIVHAQNLFTSSNFEVFVETEAGNFTGTGFTHFSNTIVSQPFTLGNRANRAIRFEYKSVNLNEDHNAVTVLTIKSVAGAAVSCVEY
jgi:hypothetical protein